jgi:predicted GIY-YIG superfamily endonuclease
MAYRPLADEYTEVGTVYLLHFDRPYKHASHYIGFTTDLKARIESHRNGTGARLMEVVKAAGIGFHVAATWEGVTREKERRLKNGGGACRNCPTCKADAIKRDEERAAKAARKA